MIDKRVADAAAALVGLDDGASIMIGGFGGSGFPAELLRAVEAKGVRGLTVIMNSLRFIEMHAPQLFEDKRIVRAVCSAARGRQARPSPYERQWHEGLLEIEMVPQGTFSERVRAGGAGIPAFFTPTGAGTPLALGKETRRFGERDHLLETALTADFCIMRAHRADRLGNISYRGTQSNFSTSMAAAAGTTIVEVNEAPDGPMPPEAVGTPGIYVDRVIQLPQAS